jgi:2,3-bisphosphoglycerate-dependent phosphoglycerate mutase
MQQTTRLFLVRHGESTGNVAGLLSGHSDHELTEKGKEQAKHTGKKLKDVQFNAAYSSDLKRAAQTAEIILGKPFPTLKHVFELRERHFGSLESQPEEHLQRLLDEHKDHYDTLTDEERWSYRYAPDIESNHEVSTRFIKALTEIAKRHPGETILVVAHGGCIRTTLIKIGFATEKELPPRSFANAGYAELVFDGKNFKAINVVGATLHR